MFKNAVIAILSTSLYFVLLGEFNFLAFICLATILFFVVWQVEEWINDFKRKLVFKKRIQKKIAEIKISPKPTKAS
jgi:hypothetical protein